MTKNYIQNNKLNININRIIYSSWFSNFKNNELENKIQTVNIRPNEEYNELFAEEFKRKPYCHWYVLSSFNYNETKAFDSWVIKIIIRFLLEIFWIQLWRF